MVHQDLSDQFRMQFNTFSSLCTSYPAGFGLFCRPDGSKGLMMPHTVLAVTVQQHVVGDFAFLYSQCINCQCPDDAPDEPRSRTVEGLLVPRRLNLSLMRLLSPIVLLRILP